MKTKLSWVITACLLCIAACASEKSEVLTDTGIALVVSFDDENYCVECLELQEAGTQVSLTDLFASAGITIATQDFGAGFGQAICGAGPNDNELTGCDPAIEDCFCNSDYSWMVFERNNATWTSSQEGISAMTVGGGEILGLRWTNFDPESYAALSKPHDFDFEQVCTKDQLLARCTN
ncbi:MAG: hypothetical protein IPJ88_09365 [Myxococcales bacterium]|nr:MAG: hypothetical protein IPJ88_09365 [Myxococcales bacterium]